MQTLSRAPAMPGAKPVAVSAFIFDVDGVLADTARLHAEAWQRLAAQEGLRFDETTPDALRGISREASLRLLLDGREIPPEQFHEWMNRKNQWFLAALESLTPRDALPGAVELLESLQRLDFKLAAASASRNARTVLRRIGVDCYFSAIVDGNAEANSRTGLHRFLLAAAALRTAPRQCVVVEDSAAGISAARAAGMKTIAVGRHTALCAADQVVQSLSEIDPASFAGP